MNVKSPPEGFTNRSSNVNDILYASAIKSSSTSPKKIILDIKNESAKKLIAQGGTIGRYTPNASNQNVQEEIDYAADRVEFEVEKKISEMYGVVKIIHDKMDLSAAHINVDWSTNVLEAFSDNPFNQEEINRPILIENNKPRLLYHFKNRGYRKYSINRPDKPYNKLSVTEKELGGMPNSSEDIKQAHAAAIESYIEKHVGFDMQGTYRDPDAIGSMYFTRTLEDWARFNINNRTKFDASISSGLAIMATQKHLYVAEKKQSKIKINFARYNNKGNTSEIIR